MRRVKETGSVLPWPDFDDSEQALRDYIIMTSVNTSPVLAATRGQNVILEGVSHERSV